MVTITVRHTTPGSGSHSLQEGEGGEGGRGGTVNVRGNERETSKAGPGKIETGLLQGGEGVRERDQMRRKKS